MADEATILQPLLDRTVALIRSYPTMRVFTDTRVFPVTKEEAVEAYRNTNVHAHFPDGSEYFLGSLVKGPCHFPAHTASPETLSRLNARIAAMNLPIKGYWDYAFGRGKGG